jgi:hypothetical protein
MYASQLISGGSSLGQSGVIIRDDKTVRIWVDSRSEGVPRLLEGAIYDDVFDTTATFGSGRTESWNGTVRGTPESPVLTFDSGLSIALTPQTWGGKILVDVVQDGGGGTGFIESVMTPTRSFSVEMDAGVIDATFTRSGVLTGTVRNGSGSSSFRGQASLFFPPARLTFPISMKIPGDSQTRNFRIEIVRDDK